MNDPLLETIERTAVRPAFELLAKPWTNEARVMMLTIGLQESQFKYRRQMNQGPATGFWQFENGGGVRGVMTHDASKLLAERLCKARGVAFTRGDVWARLETDDVLAAGFARLLLLTDPKPLPPVLAMHMAWDYYERNWRPGKPHPDKWPANHQRVLKYLGL